MAAKKEINWGNVAIGAGVTVGAVVAYKLFNREAENKTYNTFLEGWCKENVDPNLLTHPEDWYLKSADRIANAIWRYFDAVAEDDETVYVILSEINSDTDFNKLACVYKLRGPTAWPARWFYPAINLMATLDKYLDNGYKSALDELWASKGLEPLSFTYDEEE